MDLTQKEIDELMTYNLEYSEALLSEELFGGDYTSAVDLKYSRKNNDELIERINKLKDELVKDRMEQFDDYVIYLINKYLDILEGNQL